jgi:hypothetical protein
LSKFNTPRAARPAVTSPITSEPTPTIRTHEGGAGYLRDTKSELFLLAVTNMVSERTFYETSDARDDRYERLVRAATVEDPEWTVRMLTWLRGEGNLRSAALVGAAEFVRTRQTLGLDQAPQQAPRAVTALAGQHTPDGTPQHQVGRGLSRTVIDAVLQRADEPGELLAYWTRRYGRAVPKPIKRGIGDAVRRLYTERAVLKYDTGAHAFRFGDVLELVHAAPHTGRPQGDLFEHVIDRRHGRDNPIPDTLKILRERARLMDIPQGERAAMLRSWGPDASQYLRDAGMTWEALAGWLNGPMDTVAWEAIIPTMGYMALLRNLRNFDQAGVSDKVAEQVAAKLADPEEVARSRQFPFRFLSAFKNAPSLRWAWALQQGLDHSLGNVPLLPGRTLVLVDMSGSMFGSLSAKSDLSRAEAAGLFGAAVAARAQQADLVQYGTHSAPLKVRRGESLLSIIQQFRGMGGTNTWGAVRERYAGHDRVVIVTDEQAHDSYGREFHPGGMSRDVPFYIWDLAGYRAGSAPSGGRDNTHVFGGLTDAAFRMIPLLEAGRNAGWPF